MPRLPLLAAASLLLVAAAPAPDPKALRETIATLVGFGTRHTLSTTTDPKRGIGAARAWAAARFRALGQACGGCLEVETIGDRFTGPRAPDGVRVEDVIAIQRGTGDPNRVVIVQGHIDSRVNDVMDATTDAPGANDDASGTALVLEAARILSREKFAGTIVYAALSGEEQGLWGGQLLARTAKQRGWQVAAVLNNDIVGNTHGIGGEHDDTHVRVFSEGIGAKATAEESARQRAIGGEDDSPSRALAKAVARIARETHGLDVIAVRRPDRFQRGGDHIPFLEAGYPAVRFTEATEDYDRQHQTIRTENARHYGDVIDWVDFPYLARVTALNIAVLRDLASAPAAPATASIAGALSDDTHGDMGAGSGRSRIPHPLAPRRRAELDGYEGRARGRRLDRTAARQHRRSLLRCRCAGTARGGEPRHLRRRAAAAGAGQRAIDQREAGQIVNATVRDPEQGRTESHSGGVCVAPKVTKVTPRPPSIVPSTRKRTRPVDQRCKKRGLPKRRATRLYMLCSDLSTAWGLSGPGGSSHVPANAGAGAGLGRRLLTRHQPRQPSFMRLAQGAERHDMIAARQFEDQARAGDGAADRFGL